MFIDKVCTRLESDVMEKPAENINFYSIFCPMFDTDSIEFDLLEQIRRNFFQSGKKQKNKITKEFKGKTYHYSYAMENQKPMKWKKMLGGKVLEKSMPSDMGYIILIQAENKDLIKLLYFNNEHDWIKSEYYVKNTKGKPIFAFYKDGDAIQVNKYDKNLQVSQVYDVYPFVFNLDEYKIDAFNENLTTIFCRTSKGEISYCTKEQIEEINKLKRNETYESGEISEQSINEMADDIIRETNILVDELSNEIVQASKNSKNQDTGDKSDKLYKEVTWEEAINSSKNEASKNNFEFSTEMMEDNIITKIIKVGENEELFYSGKLDENQGRVGYGRTFGKNGNTIYEGEYLNDKRNGFGVHHYSTGEVFYVGNFKDNNRERLGILFKKDYENIQVGSFFENKIKNMVSVFDNNGNLEYAGLVEDGKKSGAAVSYNADDNKIFVGVFKNGEYLGRGTTFDKEGNLYYTGEFNGAQRCGFGTEYNKDASIKYRGNFKDDQYNGKGSLFFDDGRYITGIFKDGKLSGAACEYFKDGSKIYEGYFKDNRYCGEGTLYLKNGNYVKGSFADGKISGTYFEFNKDGDMVYEGEYIYSKDKGKGQSSLNERLYNGNGALFKDGKCIYKGGFVNGAKAGFGIEYNNGNVVYIGNFKNDKYDGCGILFNDNKPIFAGSFLQGKKHGRVNEIYENKVIKECIFDSDELKYVVEYSYPDMNIVYCGNISSGKKNGMGCEFSEYAEKLNEGIFEDGNIVRRMSVCMNKLDSLCECKKLNTYGYNEYGKAPEFFVDVNYNGGIYSGSVSDGRPHGKGTILYNDHRYTGEFVNGEPKGNGVIYKNDGSEIRGTFLTDEAENAKEEVFPSGVKYKILN